jgi:hypothetical protein
MIIARGVAVGLLAAVSWLSHAEAGTLFGLQFRGNDTGLYALPTADPSAAPSPIGGADVVPYEYASSAQSIAIGSTGLRRFRKVGAPAMGKDGYQQDEARSATSYYNFVPDMGTQPNKVTQAEAISIDAQTGAVVVEEATIGPLLALQFSDKGAMFGLLPESDGAVGGVQVKYFEDVEVGSGKDAGQRRWIERGQLSFPGLHAVFGLSSMDRAGEIFYCILYDPSQGYNSTSKLIGLSMPAIRPENDATAKLLVSANLSMPLMLSSLSHDHNTGQVTSHTAPLSPTCRQCASGADVSHRACGETVAWRGFRSRDVRLPPLSGAGQSQRTVCVYPTMFAVYTPPFLPVAVHLTPLADAGTRTGWSKSTLAATTPARPRPPPSTTPGSVRTTARLRTV